MAISDDMNLYQKSFAQGHNACRAAMLQAGNHSEQHLDMVDHSGEANKMVVGNSPSKCSLREGIETIRNSGIPVDVDNIQSECDAGNPPVTTDGWIPVSERMPDEYDFDI